jgi:protein-S-isoprenylcysteine O-methyltransferase Ste14
VAGIAAGLVLERVRPWPVRGPRLGRRVAGWSALAAGSVVVVRSLTAAADTRLAGPERLVTSGPYARSRNPMYVGWTLMHLGIGLVTGSGWTVSTVPAAGLCIHREVLREERRLKDQFEDEYVCYQATVGRYIPRR